MRRTDAAAARDEPPTIADHPRHLSLTQLQLVEAAYPRKVIPTGGMKYELDDDGEVTKTPIQGVTIDGSRWKTARILESFGLMEKVLSKTKVIVGFRLTERGRVDHRNRVRMRTSVGPESIHVGVDLPRSHVALLSHLATDTSQSMHDVVREAIELYANAHGRAHDVNAIHRRKKT